jgi:MFS family permease
MVSAYMQKHMRDDDRATLLSFVAMLQQLALVIMNPLMGWLAEGNLRIAFLLAGLLPALAFLFSKVKDEMFE